MPESIADRFAAAFAEMQAADKQRAAKRQERLARIRRLAGELERIEQQTR